MNPTLLALLPEILLTVAGVFVMVAEPCLRRWCLPQASRLVRPPRHPASQA